MNPSTALATVLVDELVRQGVRHVVLCPGSRSAPLAYAVQAAEHAGRLTVHVRVDERSAGFLALGLHDAIFGAAHIRGRDEDVARLSRLAFDTADRLPHALLNWWMPQTHLVRTDVASGALARIADGYYVATIARPWVRPASRKTYPNSAIGLTLGSTRCCGRPRKSKRRSELRLMPRFL